MEKIVKNKGNFFKSVRFFVFCCISTFVAGAIIASAFWYFHNSSVIQKLSAQVKPLRQKNNPYSYINPLLGYEVPNDIKEFNEFKPLEKKIQDSISKEHNANVNSYSVYFRDLTLGRWVGINETVPYAPASMMKVAIMITYFKEAETKPEILQQSLQYSTSTADEINGVALETPSTLQVGKNYTVEQLINAMIITSDNGAKNALLDNINQNDLNDVYTDLGLPNPANTDNYSISAKQYSLLLRVLYNATYLDRQYSEEALNIMSQAEFNQGLVAGVPQGTKAAQKFGESVDASNTAVPVISLSNCGIVYHTTHPYILCVMTKGADLNSLSGAIASISKIVWSEVNAYAAAKNY
jgi:beta-lactamase class A